MLQWYLEDRPLEAQEIGLCDRPPGQNEPRIVLSRPHHLQMRNPNCDPNRHDQSNISRWLGEASSAGIKQEES